MTSKDPTRCEEVQSSLQSYLSGEISPLNRSRIEAHLENCPDCALAARMIESVGRAVGSPPPLSRAKKAQLLAGIHLRLESPAPRWSFRLRVALPAMATVAAALGIYMIVSIDAPDPAPQDTLARGEDAPPPPRVEVQPPASGYVEQLVGGATVYAEAVSDLRAEHVDGTNIIEFSRGRLLVNYDRAVAERELEVRVPGLRVQVVGTVFLVDATPEATEVAVRRGLVRVLTDSGEEFRVDAGHALKLGLSPGPITPMAPPTRAAFDRRFPTGHDEQPTISTQRPQRQRAARRGGKDVSPRLKPRPEPRRAPKPLPTDAEELRALLAGSDSISGERREEAMYRLATLERRSGNGREATEWLRRLSEASNSGRAQLAQLEHAKLLRKQGRLPEAERELLALRRRPGKSLAKEYGHFELCSIFVERKRFDEALECFDEFAVSFPRSERVDAAKAMTVKLRGVLSK